MQTSTLASRTSELNKARAAFAARLSDSPFVGLQRPDVLRGITPHQRHQRALQEAAMRAGQLRGLPSVFGVLA